MIETKQSRLRIPAVEAVLGTIIAVAVGIGSGWAAAAGAEIITIIATVGYFILGGKDTDFAALVGSRPDERQASIGMRSTALTGFVLGLVALVGFVVTSAIGKPSWPFLLFSVLGGATLLAGQVIYRER